MNYARYGEQAVLIYIHVVKAEDERKARSATATLIASHLRTYKTTLDQKFDSIEFLRHGEMQVTPIDAGYLVEAVIPWLGPEPGANAMITGVTRSWGQAGVTTILSAMDRSFQQVQGQFPGCAITTKLDIGRKAMYAGYVWMVG